MSLQAPAQAPAETAKPARVKKNKRLLRVALAGIALAAVVLPAGLLLVAPRLMSNEPDARPVWKVSAGTPDILNTRWLSHKPLVVLDSRGHDQKSGQLTLARSVLNWPDGRLSPQRVVAQADGARFGHIVDEASRPGSKWSRPSEDDPASTPSTHVEIDEGERVTKVHPPVRQVTMQNGQRVVTTTTGSYEVEYGQTRLLLKRGEKVIHAWPLPKDEQAKSHYTPWLSSDGRVVTAVSTQDIELRGVATHLPPDLWRALAESAATTRIPRLEMRQWRASDGRLTLHKTFADVVRGPNSDGSLWVGKIGDQRLFDGSTVWCVLAPMRVPRNADSLVQWAKTAYRRHASLADDHQDDYDARVAKVRLQAQWDNGLMLYDPLSRRTRRFAPGNSAPFPLGEEFVNPDGDTRWRSFMPSWSTLLSDDRRLLAGNSNNNLLCVWDFASGRLLWSTPQRDAGAFNKLTFSPDGARLALMWEAPRPEGELPEGQSKILVFDARSGRPIGPPLLEESPRQRFEDARARWQKSLQDRWKKTADTLTRATPAPEGYPQQPDALQSFSWAPDSRHILAQYNGGILQLWRVP